MLLTRWRAQLEIQIMAAVFLPARENFAGA